MFNIRDWLSTPNVNLKTPQQAAGNFPAYRVIMPAPLPPDTQPPVLEIFSKGAATPGGLRAVYGASPSPYARR